VGENKAILKDYIEKWGRGNLLSTFLEIIKEKDGGPQKYVEALEDSLNLAFGIYYLRQLQRILNERK
jgi:hypothetical protein